MAEFASKGVAGSGLGLGIAGTALGILNGGLGNLFTGTNGTCGCSEDHWVNRYEATQSARIAELETEVKLRDANTAYATDSRFVPDEKSAQKSTPITPTATTDCTST